MIPEGRYLVQGVRMQAGTHSNGKDKVYVMFRVVDGPHEGEEIQATWWLATEQNARITLDNLRKCGCDMRKGSVVASTSTFGANLVEITVEHETTSQGRQAARIKYVDVPGEARGGQGAGEAMSDAEAKAFDSRWRHIALSLPPPPKATTKPAKAKDAEDVPF